jgi:hypothetical protein
MAVHFIHKGGWDMGIHLYTSSSEEIMIHIVHDPKDGYLLSYHKQIIKEQLNLKEFIERLVRIENFQKGFSEIQSKVERDMCVIVEALTSRSSERVKAVADWLDHRYANLIRNKKLVLMQHIYSVNVNQVEHRETISNNERSVTQQNYASNKEIHDAGFRLRHPIIPNEAFKKEITDDEVYYLTTP